MADKRLQDLQMPFKKDGVSITPPYTAISSISFSYVTTGAVLLFVATGIATITRPLSTFIAEDLTCIQGEKMLPFRSSAHDHNI